MEIDERVCPECAETVKLAAAKCRFCSFRFDGVEADLPNGSGSKALSRSGLVVLLIGLAFALVASIVFFQWITTSNLRDAKQASDDLVGSTAHLRSLLEADASMEESSALFHRLSDGMTYQEAVKVMGEPGSLQSSLSLNGIKTEMYRWNTPNGAPVLVTFSNGKLIMKAQDGLR